MEKKNALLVYFVCLCVVDVINLVKRSGQIYMKPMFLLSSLFTSNDCYIYNQRYGFGFCGPAGPTAD